MHSITQILKSEEFKELAAPGINFTVRRVLRDKERLAAREAKRNAQKNRDNKQNLNNSAA